MPEKRFPMSWRFLRYAFIGVFALGHVQAQQPTLGFPNGTLIYGDNQTLTLRLDCYPDHIDFEPVALYPDQTVVINLQFPAAAAGTTILIGLQSGGEITSANYDGAVTIDNNGMVSIGFRAPHDLGRCGMQFRFDSSGTLLPFFVMTQEQMQGPMRMQSAKGRRDKR